MIACSSKSDSASDTDFGLFTVSTKTRFCTPAAHVTHSASPFYCRLQDEMLGVQSGLVSYILIECFPVTVLIRLPLG